MNNHVTKMKEFLEAWRNKDWKNMARACQITWLSNNNNAEQELKDMFGQINLLEYNIKKKDILMTPSKVMAHIPIGLVSHISKSVKTEHSIGVAVREKNPYETSKSGKWGINPLSILRRRPTHG